MRDVRLRFAAVEEIRIAGVAEWPTAMCRAQLEKRLALPLGDLPSLDRVKVDARGKLHGRRGGLDDLATMPDAADEGERLAGWVGLGLRARRAIGARTHPLELYPSGTPLRCSGWVARAQL